MFGAHAEGVEDLERRIEVNVQLEVDVGDDAEGPREAEIHDEQRGAQAERAVVLHAGLVPAGDGD